MNANNLNFKEVSNYISGFPPEIQLILKKLRAVIKKAAPKADERISYGLPFYEYGGKGFEGRLIYFAAFKKHISLFIAPRNSETVPKEMKNYNVSKATYRFSLDKPIPFSLIEKTVKLMVKERDKKNSNVITGYLKGKNTKELISKDILSYNSKQSASYIDVCNLLSKEISKGLPKAENKIWHGHPVWFLDGNPIVGYSKQKPGIRLMFWSGAGFNEEGLEVKGAKFKDASVFYNHVSEIVKKDLKRWLKKSKDIQWDYKNVIKRKGVLKRLK